MTGPLALPPPAGPHPVGLWHTAFPFEGGPITLSVFYPAADREGQWAPYAFPQVMEPLGIEALNTACLLDAAPALGPFPLVLYSHGYLTHALCNTVLCGDLASHGYVVAAIGHTGEGWVQLPDGTVLPKNQTYIDYVYEPEALQAAEAIMAALAATAPDDERRFFKLAQAFHALHDGNLNDRAEVWEAHTLAAADHLSALNADPAAPLFGRLDLARGIGLTGHSFGGATAANCCLRYGRFVCGVNLDGAQLGASFGWDIGKPFMAVSGADGGGILRDMLLRNSAPSFQAVIAGVEHMGFTDKGLLGQLTGQNLPGVGRKDPREVRDILLALHLSFFSRFLLGRESPPPTPQDPDVTLYVKPQKGG